MATVTIRSSGFSSGVPGPGRRSDDGGSTRGSIVGWSRGAAARNVAWLQSVDPDGLGAARGVACTLTVGSYPATPEAFHEARREFVRRARRLGLDRVHWVVEATRHGRPHLHLAMFGDDVGGTVTAHLVVAWLTICEARGWTVSERAQTAVPITSVVGWMQYVSKHGARGVEHYQRSTPPSGWENGTGRLWGHLGPWPCPEPIQYDLTEAEFHRFRRLAVGLVYSRMRALGMTSTRARRFASRMRLPDSRLSATAGIGAWLHRDACDALVSASRGRQPVIRYSENLEPEPYGTLDNTHP